MTDYDILARLRRLEAEVAALKHHAAETDRKRHKDAPSYRSALIWPVASPFTVGVLEPVYWGA